MKIIAFHAKHEEAAVEPETADDLWLLSQIVNPGDRVRARTWRKIKLEGDEIIKKPVTLEVEAEKVEFTGEVLRVSGKILIPAEDIPKGSYHTLTLEPGSNATITKEHWHSYEKKRLEDAAKQQKPLLVCIFDRDEAHIALVSRNKHTWLAHLRGEVERKQMSEKVKTDFYSEIRKHLAEYSARHSPVSVIIASPAFWKDELLKEWKGKPKNLVAATISSGDESALQEVLVREETRAALSTARIAEEARFVEELLKRIAKQGTVCYGLKQVQEASAQGAVETLLITSKKVKTAREENLFAEIEAVMRAVDEGQGAVVVLDSDQQPGKKVDGLGGIAGLLRYKTV